MDFFQQAGFIMRVIVTRFPLLFIARFTKRLIMLLEKYAVPLLYYNTGATTVDFSGVHCSIWWCAQLFSCGPEQISTSAVTWWRYYIFNPPSLARLVATLRTWWGEDAPLFHMISFSRMKSHSIYTWRWKPLPIVYIDIKGTFRWQKHFSWEPWEEALQLIFRRSSH